MVGDHPWNGVIILGIVDDHPCYFTVSWFYELSVGAKFQVCSTLPSGRFKMVGDHPWNGGWPSFEWCWTILRMVAEHPWHFKSGHKGNRIRSPESEYQISKKIIWPWGSKMWEIAPKIGPSNPPKTVFWMRGDVFPSPNCHFLTKFNSAKSRSSLTKFSFGFS